MRTAPLDDPSYSPTHVPVDGRAPEVVEKWGAASQLRWFTRFHADLTPQPYAYWARFYCDSTQHRGQCCESCAQDGEIFADGECCCRAFKVDD